MTPPVPTPPELAPPSDLELMMFHDGELDEARHREVEAYLRGEGTAVKSSANKLAGLGLVSALVVESQIPTMRAQERQADTIAAAVMAKLDAGRDASPRATGNEKSDSHTTPRLDGAAEPANDNGRFIMVLAGLAAAAAAALFVWGRSAPPEAPSAAVEAIDAPAEMAPVPSETVAIVPPTATSSAAVPSLEEAEGQPSVEVASVDFSAASGAVYYVPSDSAGQTTAVVWLKDE